MELYPTCISALLGLVELHRQRDESEAALALLQNAVEQISDTQRGDKRVGQLYVKLGELFEQRHQIEEGYQYFTQALRLRPKDLLVRIANQFQSTIMIGKGSEFVDCKSILSLLTLGAAQGTELSLRAEGDDADQALRSIVELFETGFEDPKTRKDAEPCG